MSRRVWFFGILSVVAVAAFIQLTFFNTHAGLPVGITHRGSAIYVSAPGGIPLAAGLQSGDQLEIKQMSAAARAAFLLPETIKAGLSYDMVVRRGNQSLRVSVISQVPSPAAFNSVNQILAYLLPFAFLVLGLLALWRGRNLAAWGLGLMSLNVVILNGMRSIPVSASIAVFLDVLGNCIVAELLLTGLYLMAYAVVAEGLKPVLKRTFTWIFAISVALLAGLSCIRTLGIVYFAWNGVPALILPAISIWLGLIAFLMLVLGYTRAGAEQRLRIRWILASTGMVLLAVVLSYIATQTSNPVSALTLAILNEIAFLLAVAGYGYALLRHRLVDVRIVLNRTLLYGVITAIVVGVFAAINALVERETLGRGASLILELIVPLALGIVLGSLRKYLDTYINRLVFRRQYRAEQALNDFARTCSFIEQPEHLLDLTAQQVFDHSHAESVALYERQAQGYTRVRQHGTAEFPQQVEADDLAFVRLRAGDHEADLHEMRSALGKGGYVFSMAVRGKLIGALVCGPRPAEQYTADERALLFHVAQQAGAALYALRSREHENFVDSVARGALDATSARERARQLVAAWQTA
ncbi:MAG TPA: GAF domain-containing protein [Gammaproteobacteria bacterium]|nr:GAF domain-containing protein [Gammaproteobacteria bacterium]